MSDLKAKMHGFCLGSAPNPAGGAYSALPDLLAGFNWEGKWKGPPPCVGMVPPNG